MEYLLIARRSDNGIIQAIRDEEDNGHDPRGNVTELDTDSGMAGQAWLEKYLQNLDEEERKGIRGPEKAKWAQGYKDRGKTNEGGGIRGAKVRCSTSLLGSS